MTTRLYTQEAQSITEEHKMVAKKFQMKDEESGGGMACICHAKLWSPGGHPRTKIQRHPRR